MMQPVVHVDVEEWLAGWIREHLPPIIDGMPLTLAWTSNAERPTAAGGAVKEGEVHVIVRDDAGPRRDLLLKDASVGVTVLGASRADQRNVRRVAERLVALIEARAPIDPASPVADVSDVLGPYNVPSSNDEARLYSTMQLTLVGRAL